MNDAETKKSIFDNTRFINNDREGDEDLGTYTFIGVII